MRWRLILSVYVTSVPVRADGTEVKKYIANQLHKAATQRKRQMYLHCMSLKKSLSKSFNSSLVGVFNRFCKIVAICSLFPSEAHLELHS